MEKPSNDMSTQSFKSAPEFTELMNGTMVEDACTFATGVTTSRYPSFESLPWYFIVLSIIGLIMVNFYKAILQFQCAIRGVYVSLLYVIIGVIAVVLGFAGFLLWIMA